MSPACHSNRHNPRAQEALGKGKSVAVALFQFILGAAFFFPSQMASAGVATWRGNHNNNSFWTSGSNWTTPTQITNGNLDLLVAGDSLVFQGSKRVNNFNDTTADTNYAGITFQSGGSAFILAGSRITLTDSIINNSVQSQTINLAMAFGATRTINTASGDIRINSVISGAGGLTKSGTEQLVLSATNTYTGTTTVSGGTLAVNGSIGSQFGTTVQTGAILQGSGSINSSVTIQNGGTLASGNSIESLATGALSLEALSTFVYEVDSSAALGVAGDLTAVTGNLSLNLTNAAILTLTELGAGSWTDGDKLTLISYSGVWNGGLFDFGGVIADDSAFTFSGKGWILNYNDTVAGTNFTSDLTGTSFVTMTAVAIPEPSAALLGCLAALLLLRRRR
jgi:autotransporter-associated beta strand protein